MEWSWGFLVARYIVTGIAQGFLDVEPTMHIVLGLSWGFLAARYIVTGITEVISRYRAQPTMHIVKGWPWRFLAVDTL